MKKIFLIFIAASSILFTACDRTEPEVYDPEKGQTLAFFDTPTSTLEVLLGGEEQMEIKVGVTSLSDQNRTVTVSIDEELTTTTADNYSLADTQVIIPAGEFFGTLLLTGVDSSLGDETENIVINLESVTNGIVSTASHTVSMLVICPVPIEFFTGTYHMEQISAQQDPFFPTYGEAFEAQNVTVNAVTSTIREFNFSFFPTGFDVQSIMTLTFDCGTIKTRGVPLGGGLSCDQGATQPIGQGTSPTATYSEDDLTNDDVVIVELLNFEPDGGCGTGNYAVTLQFTKQ